MKINYICDDCGEDFTLDGDQEVEGCIGCKGKKLGVKILSNNGNPKILALGVYLSLKRNGKIKVNDDGVEYADIYEKVEGEESKKEIIRFDYDEELVEKFRRKDLLDLIKEEISKSHLEDDNLKMSLFLTYVSGLLNNPARRQSFQITGRSAEGKDNIQISCLKHFPNGSYIFLTSATQSVLEDDLHKYPIIAFSEINLFKESGANRGLLEVIKQRTELGIKTAKKDIRVQNKEMRLEDSEQGVVTFGTTEAEQDEELSTRFLKGTIRATPSRIKVVNDNTLDTFSDIKKLMRLMEKKDSWIKTGLEHFWKNKPKYEIIIPYAKFLKEKIDGVQIFDNSDPRSQRDIKRLLSLVCATTFLFQEQRDTFISDGTEFIISEPCDLINTLKYANEFFEQTYTGMDLRISDALDFIKSKGKGVWIDKLEIQEHLNIKHRSTINNYLWDLEQKGFIERSKGVQLNERFGLRSYKGNHIYYTSVQKEFKKRLISVQLNKLKEFLDSKCAEISVQFDENNKITRQDKKEFSIFDTKEVKNEHLKMNTSEVESQEIKPVCDDKLKIEAIKIPKEVSK